MMEDKTARFKDFCIFLNQVRFHFLDSGFIETPTPTLVSCPGMEAHLEPFSTQMDGKIYFLPTSPEIHLKKRLCQGFERIFELRPCFRKDPPTPNHRPEFFMLEWYRANEGLDSLCKDIEGLLNHLKKNGFWPHETKLERTSFHKLFKSHFDFEFTPQTSAAELKTLFGRLDLYFHDSDSKVDLIHRLLMEKLEPELKGLVVLEDFPPEMAILSQIGENGFAKRFELYMNGVELANAFDEVNDPEIQRERWLKDQEERRELGRPLLVFDEELLSLMSDPGMPKASGIALGLDRLFMAGCGLRDISEIGF